MNIIKEYLLESGGGIFSCGLSRAVVLDCLLTLHDFYTVIVIIIILIFTYLFHFIFYVFTFSVIYLSIMNFF